MQITKERDSDYTLPRSIWIEMEAERGHATFSLSATGSVTSLPDSLG